MIDGQSMEPLFSNLQQIDGAAEQPSEPTDSTVAAEPPGPAPNREPSPVAAEPPVPAPNREPSPIPDTAGACVAHIRPGGGACERAYTYYQAFRFF